MADRKTELRQFLIFAEDLLKMKGYNAELRAALLKAREQIEEELHELNSRAAL